MASVCVLALLSCSSSSEDPDGGGPPIDEGVVDKSVVDGSAGDLPVTTHDNVIVTELMPNPSAVFDNDGEWFEIHNPTQNEIDLDGWTIKDEKSDSHVIKGPLSIKAGEYLVLARNKDSATNGGVQGAYQYDNLNLANTSDQVVLVDKNGKEVNRVAYDSAWGIYAGVSTALKAPNLDNTKQDSWCPSKEAWAGSKGDHGSPGGPNTCGTLPTPPDAGPPTDGPELKHYLSFNEKLCANIASSVKTISIRNGHRTGFTVGEWILLICSTSKTTFKAQLTEIRHTTYGGITQKEWTDDGFKSQQEMLTALQQYYPGITLADNATVFRWTGTAPLP